MLDIIESLIRYNKVYMKYISGILITITDFYCTPYVGSRQRHLSWTREGKDILPAELY